MSEQDLSVPLESPGQARMDVLVGYLLLGGVMLSLLLLVAGLTWKWTITRQFGFDYPIVGMNFFEFVTNEIRIVMHGEFRPRVLVNGGIAVLMLTPYLRVLASVLYFAIGLKNWKYTVFTSIVLAILTYSLFLR